jgi:Protein of unknown function (DUF3631)
MTMSNENVVGFPKSETKSETKLETAEEKIRRQMAEAQRLASLAPGEYLLWAPDSAERLDMPIEQLVAAVKAILAKREKEALEAKTEAQQRERRVEKQRASTQREQERQQREQRRAQEKADKEAEKRQREREKELARIAKLPSAEHEPRLAALAKRSGGDLEFLRGEFAMFAAVEESSDGDYVEPWPESVGTAALLSEVAAQIQRYVVLHDNNARVAIVLWVFFAWIHAEAAVHSPILAFTSADADCGKSTACGVLKYLTPRALVVTGITAANIYRLVDERRPTLIVDEADDLFEHKADVKHIINTSWTRGSKIPRQVGGRTYFFDPFCPKIISGAGLLLPRTTATRTILVRLLPKLKNEQVDDFMEVDDETFIALRRKLTRWAADNVAALKDARPAMAGLNNRIAKNWKLQFAVADLAGGDWPKLARQAAIKFMRERREPSESKRMLAAFYELAVKHGTMLASANVERWLTADKDGEWADFRGRGRPITRREIALLLDAHEIHPRVIHPDGHTAERGYCVADEPFTKAFRHFLGKSPPRKRTTVRKTRGKARIKGRSKRRR